MEEIFNKEKALTHTMNDQPLLRELLEFTLEDVPVMLGRLEKAIGVNTESVARLAHKIKGSAGAVSAEKLFTAAFELEETAKEGDSSRLRELYLFVSESFKEFSEDDDVRSLLA